MSQLDEPIAKKAYYSIGDVCELTGLKPHVLRYWETQFEPLRPTKNRAGNRVFKPADIELVLLIKHLLYDQKYTINGARRHLKQTRRSAEMAEERKQVVTPSLMEEIRTELDGLLEILTPAASGGSSNG
ncbi:MAG: MerR family transcriptional regulator [Gemmatimonadota bacterium]|nr:MerR family transcriptional regulator [Gemmatimonadota bacterium]